jgi:CheY-like chemotaxis protein
MAKNSVTILIVDDDGGHAELVRRNLRRAGLDNCIETVSCGAEALDFVFCRGAHAAAKHAGNLLVLLDINMPGVDGVEVLRQMKADQATRKIPVVVLSTADDPREIDRCYALGCNVYVTKPVDPTEFVVAIHRLGLLLSVVSLPTNLTRDS